jgi:hypothetical protein
MPSSRYSTRALIENPLNNINLKYSGERRWIGIFFIPIVALNYIMILKIQLLIFKFSTWILMFTIIAPFIPRTCRSKPEFRSP